MNMRWILAGACGVIAAYSTVQWFRHRNSRIWPALSCRVANLEAQRYEDNGHQYRLKMLDVDDSLGVTNAMIKLDL